MSKKRILYAEDDYASQKLLKMKLLKAGFECDAAYSGTSALKMYEENQYDLIILDQHMPGLDGEDIAVEIRKSKTDITLIAITSDDTLKAYLYEKGFNEVVIKPLHGDNIINMINSYLFPDGQ